MQQFLRFVVEETLEGRVGEIKESVVAIHVFGRSSDFDSHSDSVVRVQATHLRKRLREYYRVEGQHDGLVIELPPGAYVPVFRPATVPAGAVAGRPRRRWPLPVVAALAVLAAAVGLWTSGWLTRDSPTSIAVLPFATLDAGPQDDYLSEGIAEDLMTALARSPDLRVVARSSAFQFRQKNVNARSVGRDLGASVLVEGSIRGNRDHLKVSAQLVNASSGFDLWSESWEGPASDAPLFEEQIVRGVHQALGKWRGKREPTALATAIRPPLPSAQEAYWRGRYLLSKGYEARAASIRFLEQAARADPQYAPAYAGLATAYSTMAFHLEGDIDELLAKARSAGGRALQLDPASAESLASLAVLRYAFDHDWASAERDFERALELNPSYARGHLQYAMGLVSRAKFDAAVAHFRAARVLDPLSYAIGNDLAVALECAGRYDESIASARQTLRSDPKYVYAHIPLGIDLAVQGNSTAAIAEFEPAIQALGRSAWILGPLGYALARAGRKADAANIAREIESADGPGVQLAHVYAGLGDKPRALDALERAYAQRIVDLNFMAVDPLLASLRAEPRFLALKRRMGL
ncbi:MAG: tetratricopeptide repeat protein [Bryobacteraceae bacterium]